MGLLYVIPEQFKLCLLKTLYIEHINTIFLLLPTDIPSNNYVVMIITCEGNGNKGQWPILSHRNISAFT
jgi:hypothetical protein